jgi:dTDP-4-amino-4,6-dideoxygalactose transaminase
MHGPGTIVGFKKFTEFETALSEYTGAPHVVLTDCCTHAVELCLRLKGIGMVTLPYRSYISIPMTMHKLNIQYQYDTEVEWQYEYRIGLTNTWDSARNFDKNMYRANQMQCLSFGHSKRLEIGHGGAILTSNRDDAEQLRQMAYDGRDLTISPWQDQKVFRVGYHYKPSIEDCEKGLYMLANNKLKTKESQLVKYPDLTEIEIVD